MENISNDFAGNITDVTTFGTMETTIQMYDANFPDPDDEEDDDNSNEGSEDDPPLDEDVVHSPVPPKTGKPQK